MKKVLVPIADGSEEMEAVTIIDTLRRAGAEVHVASVMEGRLHITASRGVKLEADCHINECTRQDWDMIALPGGMPGAEHLHDCEPLLKLVQQQLQNQQWLAAICASPAVVLGRHNLMADHHATCFPTFQEELRRQAKSVSAEQVVADGKLITSQGPGTAIPFALHLVSALYDENKAEEVAKGLAFPFGRVA